MINVDDDVMRIARSDEQAIYYFCSRKHVEGEKIEIHDVRVFVEVSYGFLRKTSAWATSSENLILVARRSRKIFRPINRLTSVAAHIKWLRSRVYSASWFTHCDKAPTGIFGLSRLQGPRQINSYAIVEQTLYGDRWIMQFACEIDSTSRRAVQRARLLRRRPRVFLTDIFPRIWDSSEIRFDSTKKDFVSCVRRGIAAGFLGFHASFERLLVHTFWDALSRLQWNNALWSWPGPWNSNNPFNDYELKRVFNWQPIEAPGFLRRISFYFAANVCEFVLF